MSWEDNNEPLDFEEIIYEFVDNSDFFDELYDSCGFATESADDGEWIVIEDAPDSEDFVDGLIDFADEYAKDTRGTYLKEWEKDELVETWNKEFDKIFEEQETHLIDTYRDRLDDGPDYDDWGD